MDVRNRFLFALFRSFKHHADVVQSWDEAAAVGFAAAGCAVCETDDVGAVLAEASGKRQLLGVVGERYETGLTVGVVTHEDGKFPARSQDSGAIGDESRVAFKECVQVWGA